MSDTPDTPTPTPLVSDEGLREALQAIAKGGCEDFDLRANGGKDCLRVFGTHPNEWCPGCVAIAALAATQPTTTEPRDEGPSHVLTVYFDEGDTEYLTLECLLNGPERPCAVIDCGVDHEDVTRDCIEAHGAIALNKCWAEEWYEAGGRESLNTEALEPVRIPVAVDYDEGIVVEPAAAYLEAKP